jgi:prepilin-type N-terminal cleavage/methylation domain-containing protein
VTQRDGLRSGRRGEQGFTLIELVVALAVLGVVLGAAVPAMFSALNLSRNNRNRSIGAGLAAQEIDIVRDLSINSFTALTTTTLTSTQVVDGTTYTVSRSAEWETPGATTSACSSSIVPNQPQYLRITVLVSWPDMRGVQPVRNQTIVAPPTGSFNPYLASIGVQVKDINNKPTASMPVTVALTTSPFTSTSLSTPPDPNSDGCVYFAGLAPGSYTVTLSKAGWVDGQLDAADTINVTLKAGDSVQLQPVFDQAGSLSVTFGSASTPAGTVPPGVALTVYNTSLTPSGTKVLTGVTPAGSPRLVPGLYPYASGYKIWAGDCADADPEGLKPPPPTPGNPYYPGKVRPTATTVTSGGTTAVTFALPSVDVKVTKGSTPAPVANATVTVTAYRAPDSNSCTSGDTLPVTGTTDAAGVLRISLPFGTWSFGASTTSPALSGTTSVPALVALTPSTPASPVATATVQIS